MKALRTAAFVVGAAALVASGVGAAVGASILGGVAAGAAAGTAATFAGLTAATFTTIGVALSATAGVLSLVAAATAPKGTVGGNATKFKIDKEAGIPVVIGETYVGGNVVHRQYYNRPGDKMKNQLESWVTILSLGPVLAVGPLLIDKTPVGFDAGGQAVGTYRGNMWLDTQRGLCPETRALAGPFGTFPGWSGSSKLSGLAADLWTLDFDSKNEKFPNGVPERGRIVQGVLVYDPRLDSTYPGGSGPCRLGDPSTYVYSQNPGPHAITWAYGHYQNGVKMAGGGMRAAGIDLAPFVEWSNVCDANKWTVGGLVYSTVDNDWDVLKMICQAGAAEPMAIGAQLSVLFSAPRVSIGTITSADITAEIDAPAMVGRRKRRNTIIPSVRLASHGWEMVPLDPVVVPGYVAIDGGSRPKEISFPLVQDATQGAQLGMYAMLNDRELDGILVPAKVYALGYRPGDCITLQVPEANLIGREVVVRQREIDGGSMGVALTCRTEDSSKHAFALGKSGTPPRTPDLSNPGIDRTAPDAGDWSVAGTTLSADGVATPALIITGNANRITATEVIFDYRPYVAGAGPEVAWTGASLEPSTVTRKEITSVTATTAYEVGIRYRMRGAVSDRLILGPVSTGAYEGVGGGEAAYTMLLTNDVHQLPTDAAGNVTSYAGASTSIQVFRGATDVTADFELGYDDLPGRNPQGLSVSGTYPDFAVDAGLDANEPTAAFTFLIVGKAGTGSAGVTLRKTFSLSKSTPGADGSPPPLISLSSSAVVARYDAFGALIAGQSIDFRATRRNSAIATVWYLINASGEEVFSGTAQAFVDAGPDYWSTSDNDTLKLTPAGLGANMAAHGGSLGRISLRASLGAGSPINDVVAIQKVQDGRNGVDALPGEPGKDGQT